MLLDCLPVTGGCRIDGGRFKDGGADTVEERSVNDVPTRSV